MNNFKAFAAKVEKQFSAMSQHELFRVNVPGDDIWEAYLAAFPEGTNPIYRVRTEHDGSYDRSTVRKIGNVVRITLDGELMSIWDEQYDYPYNEVAAVLAEKVKAATIDGLFRTKEAKLGYVQTAEALPDGKLHVWNHFHANIATRHHSTDVGEVLGEAHTTVAVFKRGLDEITSAALGGITDLIDQNGLYRGEEFKPQVRAFAEFHRRYQGKSEREQNVLLWSNVNSPVARFRNTVIGTLAVDLSEGVDADRAVASFESKVAPTNYKRPTAVITQGMVTEAMKTIQGLDLEPALSRRYAKLSDVSVNNVLWVSNASQSRMKDGVLGILEGAVTRKADSSTAEAISAADFIGTVLPKVRSLEMHVQNRHQKNLVSLTTGDGTPLFKWGNQFAWSYNGDITDAIKERVKAAGGNVQADLRVSLAWYNYDDLDLHAESPYGHIYYGNKLGVLDVDMNAGSGTTRSPVENLAFLRPKDGRYSISVHQFTRRETSNVGFTLEVECNGRVEQLSYDRAVTGTIEAVVLIMKGGSIEKMEVRDKSIRHQGLSQVAWGVQTESFVPVSTVMLSPNHWDGREIGNKHWFFLLDGCANPEPTRGIYNEFLRSDLEQHRKVFEVLGSKTKCQPAGDQLSGVGFSSTIRESVNVRAIGQTINKLYKINF